jgi:hypothetical protein
MILIQKHITAANVNEQIKQLYQTAFPENEQIPWDDLVRLIGDRVRRIHLAGLG